jgi:hypothetical protein
MSEPFPKYQRSGQALLATMFSLEIAGEEILIAAPDVKTLISVLRGIAPDVDWDKEQSEQPACVVRVAFVEAKLRV